MKTNTETPQLKEERDIFFTLNPNATEQDFKTYLQQEVKKVQAWIKAGYNTESNQVWLDNVTTFISDTTVSYCEVRPDILENGLSVPVGNYYYSGRDKLPYRWSYNDELFEVYVNNEWQQAYSIDFKFNQ